MSDLGICPACGSNVECGCSLEEMRAAERGDAITPLDEMDRATHEAEAEQREIDRMEAAIERLRCETDPDYARAKRLGQSIRERDEIIEAAGTEIASLRTALAAEREAHEETRRLVADLEMRLDAQPTGTRICDSIACRVAVIRHDGLGRSDYCAAGHKARWVAIDSQDDVLSRAESAERERDALRERAERAEAACAEIRAAARDVTGNKFVAWNGSLDGADPFIVAFRALVKRAMESGAGFALLADLASLRATVTALRALADALRATVATSRAACLRLADEDAAPISGAAGSKALASRWEIGIVARAKAMLAKSEALPTIADPAAKGGGQ